MKNQRKVPGRNTPPTLRFVPMETVQQSGKILILTNVYLAISYLVRYSGPIAIYRAGLQMFLLKKVEQEVSDLLYRRRPEVHLMFLTPSDKNGPL